MSDVIVGLLHTDDTIDLARIDAISGGAEQTFLWGGQNTATVANSITWSESDGNTILHLGNNGDTIVDMQIVLVGVSA